MKCQSLFSRKNKKNMINLSSVEFTWSVTMVKVCGQSFFLNNAYNSSFIIKNKRTNNSFPAKFVLWLGRKHQFNVINKMKVLENLKKFKLNRTSDPDNVI